jgi:hypothetical protein
MLRGRQFVKRPQVFLIELKSGLVNKLFEFRILFNFQARILNEFRNGHDCLGLKCRLEIYYNSL